MPISTDIILRKDSQHGAVLLKQVIYIDGDDDDGGGDLVGDSDDDANDDDDVGDSDDDDDDDDDVGDSDDDDDDEGNEKVEHHEVFTLGGH